MDPQPSWDQLSQLSAKLKRKRQMHEEVFASSVQSCEASRLGPSQHRLMSEPMKLELQIQSIEFWIDEQLSAFIMCIRMCVHMHERDG
jgi:hypothetical protein